MSKSPSHENHLQLSLYKAGKKQLGGDRADFMNDTEVRRAGAKRLGLRGAAGALTIAAASQFIPMIEGHTVSDTEILKKSSQAQDQAANVAGNPELFGEHGIKPRTNTPAPHPTETQIIPPASKE